MFGCFALLGSIIAAVGVYGMLSFDVVARRKDMAIRVAFGAHPAAVAGSLIHDVMSVSLVGLALGIGLTAICGSYLSALLYGVGPRDVMTFALAAGGVLLIITLAAVGPTMSALSVRPGAVLRHE